MKITRKIGVLALMLCYATNLHPQQNLEIQKLFRQYGKKTGVVMVELNNETIGDYKFSLFKSISITHNPEAADFARQCVEKDQSKADKVKQISVNGIVQAVYLEFARSGKYSRLILFNEDRKETQKTTLIYIESEAEAEEVLKFILKKK